ncbi:MAG TPA: M14 family metallopeptidase [Pyrinomonadaceae bacterium]|nr:M14 family metallopeptidase [Pyrinomonadaceae bacterium]
MSDLCLSLIAALVLLILPVCALGIDNPAAHLDSAIPSPRSVLGFTPGDDRTIADWREITNYFARLDLSSDRVLVQTLGETTRGRPLIVALISAPENIRDLSKYKEIQRRLADPRTVTTEAERDRLVHEGKAVVAISCSIHSNEIVASQMSMQLAYELAAAQDAPTREILQNTILLLIPSPNPDGIDIVADWYRKTLGTPYEGKDPPELYHHYAGHDDNRDWFMLNLRETRLVTRLFWKEWYPSIVYDIHQQGSEGSRFFVPPFYDPSNPHIAPLLLRQVGLLGHKIAADLQAAGFKGVITNAMYDTWWHGGFRTAPYYHNSIGILSEAASAKLMTPVNVTREQLASANARGMLSALNRATNFPDPWPGGVWRARDIMNLEMAASRAVLSMAAKYRADYVRNFYELGRANLSTPIPQGEPIAYLIPAGQGSDEAVAKMVSALTEQGVEVFRLDSELHVARGARSKEQGRLPSGFIEDDEQHPIWRITGNADASFQEAPAGSYIVFVAQPTRNNVRALFEPQNYPERRGAGGEAERPYDVAGWTLPMQMGVETLALKAIKEPAPARRLTLMRSEAEVRKDLGLTARGAAASPIVNPLKRSVRLALYKSWTPNMDEGWTRYVFDTFNVPYQSLLDRDVREGNLRVKYDVIILPSMRAREIVEGNPPDSYPAEFTGGITETGVANLRRFVEEGGTLICFDHATEFAIKRFNLPLSNALEGLRSSEFYAPGSILSIHLDESHSIARGLPSRMDAYFINSAAFDVTDTTRARIIARYDIAPSVLRSGWLLGAHRLAGKAALVEVSHGSGRVILFGFRPQHRAQTWGTFPLLFNAIASATS